MTDSGKETKVTGKESGKVLDVAVILDNDQALRDVIATDDNFNIIIEPKNVRSLFRLLGKYAKEGKKIRRLILAGHGHWTQHHIGSMLPQDVDLDLIRQHSKENYSKVLDREREIKMLDDAIESEKDAKRKAEFKRRLEETKKDYEKSKNSFDEFREMENELLDMEGVMDSGAVVGLVNCCAAYDEPGRKFMNDIAEVLLAKNGGRITGCTGKVDVTSVDSIWSGLVYWLHNGEWRYADEPVLVKSNFHTWETIEKQSGGESRRRCGAPCKDFERYGFCDNKVKSGYCHWHR